MSPRLFLTAILTLSTLLVVSRADSAPVEDILIGKVNMPATARVDAQAKKELATLARKIKKTQNNGTVKITGDISAAKSQDEYLVKAAFMARNVAVQLKPLLSVNHQIYITAAMFDGEKRGGINSVEIRLYPYQLQERTDVISSQQLDSEPLATAPQADNEQPVVFTAQPPAQSGLLTPASTDFEQTKVSSKKELLEKESEDPVRANELVNKAKARAAEKAKRLQQER